MRKTYFSIDTPEGHSNDFTRHAFEIIDTNDKVSDILMGQEPQFYSKPLAYLPTSTRKKNGIHAVFLAGHRIRICIDLIG